MGLYLKDMKPPVSCIACWLNRGEKRPERGLSICCPYSDGVVREEKYLYGGILPSCGITDAGKHGRLIDADSRIEKLEELLKYCVADRYTAQRTREMIVELATAPTVIAEEK